MTISYTITEERTFEFEPNDIIALAIESRRDLGYPTDPESVYDTVYDNLDTYLEELGLPPDANDGEGVSGWVEKSILKEIDKLIDWDKEELL